MLIALDYDGTYTKDPALWAAFIELAHDHGHEIIGVTMRAMKEAESMASAYQDGVDSLIFTNRMAKKDCVERSGLVVDVWIDDTPEWLFKDARA